MDEQTDEQTNRQTDKQTEKLIRCGLSNLIGSSRLILAIHKQSVNGLKEPF